MRLFRRFTATGMAAIYLWTNVVAGHAAEANFWAERRQATAQTHQRSPQTQLASASMSPARMDQEQVLAQLPQISHVTLAGNGAPPSATAKRLPNSLKKALSRSSSQKEISFWVAKSLSPYGSVREIRHAASADAPFIIHIQDAHGLEDAQRNMASIIETVNRGLEGVHPLVVGVEGAAGGFDFAPYRNFPDPDITRDIASYFLKQGFIGAPEFVGLSATNPPALWGVEDVSLYEGNIRALKDSIPAKEAAENMMRGLKSRTGRLKAKIYSEELQLFDRHFSGYKNRTEGLGGYVRYLMGVRPAETKKPNLSLLVRALSLEDKLDFRQVEMERLRLVEALVKKLSQDQTALLVQESLRHRAAQTSYADYYQFLKNLCKRNGIDLTAYGPLNDYVDYVLLAETIDRNKLLDELLGLERSAQDDLARTPEQKRLVAANRNILLLEKLFSHTMTMADWVEYDGDKERALGVDQELDALAAAAGLPPEPQTGRNPLTSDFIRPFEDFCRSATLRNAAMTNNLLKRIDQTGSRCAVLVAGGFHSDGLTEIFRRKDISYMVVTPKIAEVPKDNNYLDVFARDPLPLEKMLEGEKIYLVYPLGFADKVIQTYETYSRQLKDMFLAFQTRRQQLKVRGEVGEDMAERKAVADLMTPSIPARIGKWFAKIFPRLRETAGWKERFLFFSPAWWSAHARLLWKGKFQIALGITVVANKLSRTYNRRFPDRTPLPTWDLSDANKSTETLVRSFLDNYFSTDLEAASKFGLDVKDLFRRKLIAFINTNYPGTSLDFKHNWQEVYDELFSDRDRAEEALLRISAILTKYLALTEEVNRRVNRLPIKIHPHFMGVTLLHEGAFNPMRNYGWQNPETMTLGLNLEVLLDPTNDEHSIGDVAHEIGHGLTPLLSGPKVGLPEDEEVRANWIAAQISTPEEILAFIETKIATHIRFESQLSPDTAAQLAAFALFLNLPAIPALAPWMQSPLTQQYLELYESLQWEGAQGAENQRRENAALDSILSSLSTLNESWDGRRQEARLTAELLGNTALRRSAINRLAPVVAKKPGENDLTGLTAYRRSARVLSRLILEEIMQADLTSVSGLFDEYRERISRDTGRDWSGFFLQLSREKSRQELEEGILEAVIESLDPAIADAVERTMARMKTLATDWSGGADFMLDIRGQEEEGSRRRAARKMREEIGSLLTNRLSAFQEAVLNREAISGPTAYSPRDSLGVPGKTILHLNEGDHFVEIGSGLGERSIAAGRVAASVSGYDPVRVNNILAEDRLLAGDGRADITSFGDQMPGMEKSTDKILCLDVMDLSTEDGMRESEYTASQIINLIKDGGLAHIKLKAGDNPALLDLLTRTAAKQKRHVRWMESTDIGGVVVEVNAAVYQYVYLTMGSETVEAVVALRPRADGMPAGSQMLNWVSEGLVQEIYLKNGTYQAAVQEEYETVQVTVSNAVVEQVDNELRQKQWQEQQLAVLQEEELVYVSVNWGNSIAYYLPALIDFVLRAVTLGRWDNKLTGWFQAHPRARAILGVAGLFVEIPLLTVFALTAPLAGFLVGLMLFAVAHGLLRTWESYYTRDGPKFEKYLNLFERLAHFAVDFYTASFKSLFGFVPYGILSAAAAVNLPVVAIALVTAGAIAGHLWFDRDLFKPIYRPSVQPIHSDEMNALIREVLDFNASSAAVSDREIYLEKLEMLLTQEEAQGLEFAEWLDVSLSFTRNFQYLAADRTSPTKYNRLADILKNLGRKTAELMAAQQNVEVKRQWVRISLTAQIKINAEHNAEQFGLISDYLTPTLRAGIWNGHIMDKEFLEQLAREFGAHPGANDLALPSSERPSVAARTDPGEILQNNQIIDELKRNNPGIYHAVFSEDNLAALLRYASFLRYFIGGSDFSNDLSAPLDFAIKNGVYFRVGENLYICPVTESFRRFVLFEMEDGKKGASVRKAVELKAPGFYEEKRELYPESFTVAARLHEQNPDIVEPPIAFLEISHPIWMYEKEMGASNDNPARIFVTDYSFDAKRAGTYIDALKVNNMLDQNSVYDLVDRTADALARTHAAGLWAGTDGGLENLRIYFDSRGKSRVHLAGDVEGYETISDATDRDFDIDSLLSDFRSKIPGWNKAMDARFIQRYNESYSRSGSVTPRAFTVAPEHKTSLYDKLDPADAEVLDRILAGTWTDSWDEWVYIDPNEMNNDGDGRTVYQKLRVPVMSDNGRWITHLRSKGVRWEMDASGAVPIHKGSGRVDDQYAIDDDGSIRRQGTLEDDEGEAQGGLRLTQADREYRAMKLLSDDALCDEPVLLAIYAQKHDGEPLAAVVAGMETEDWRPVQTPDYIRLHQRSPENHFKDLDHAQSMEVIRQSAKMLRAMHDKGIYHRYLHPSNLGFLVGSSNDLPVIFRDFTHMILPDESRRFTEEKKATLRLWDIGYFLRISDNRMRMDDPEMILEFMKAYFKWDEIPGILTTETALGFSFDFTYYLRPKQGALHPLNYKVKYDDEQTAVPFLWNALKSHESVSSGNAAPNSIAYYLPALIDFVLRAATLGRWDNKFTGWFQAHPRARAFLGVAGLFVEIPLLTVFALTAPLAGFLMGLMLFAVAHGLLRTWESYYTRDGPKFEKYLNLFERLAHFAVDFYTASFKSLFGFVPYGILSAAAAVNLPVVAIALVTAGAIAGHLWFDRDLFQKRLPPLPPQGAEVMGDEQQDRPAPAEMITLDYHGNPKVSEAKLHLRAHPQALSGLNEKDRDLLFKFLTADRPTQERLADTHSGDIVIRRDKRDENGRTVYFKLSTPLVVGGRTLTWLRIKGARPFFDSNGDLQTHYGNGRVDTPLIVDEEGYTVAGQAVDRPQGAMTTSESEREFAMMQRSLNKPWRADYPVAIGTIDEIRFAGEPLSFIVAGMEEMDMRCGGQDGLTPLFSSPGRSDWEYWKDWSANRSDFAKRVGETLRAYHDHGLFHRYPHLGNIGVTKSAGEFFPVLRDLGTSILREEISGPYGRRREAVLRLLDVLRLIHDLGTYDLRTAFLKGYFGDDEILSALNWFDSMWLIEILMGGALDSRKSAVWEISFLKNLYKAIFSTAAPDVPKEPEASEHGAMGAKPIQHSFLARVREWIQKKFIHERKKSSLRDVIMTLRANQPVRTLYYPGMGEDISRLYQMIRADVDQTIVGVDPIYSPASKFSSLPIPSDTTLTNLAAHIEQIPSAKIQEKSYREVNIEGIRTLRFQVVFEYEGKTKMLVYYRGDAAILSADKLEETRNGYDVYFTRYPGNFSAHVNPALNVNGNALNEGGLIFINYFSGVIGMRETDLQTGLLEQHNFIPLKRITIDTDYLIWQKSADDKKPRNPPNSLSFYLPVLIDLVLRAVTLGRWDNKFTGWFQAHPRARAALALAGLGLEIPLLLACALAPGAVLLKIALFVSFAALHTALRYAENAPARAGPEEALSLTQKFISALRQVARDTHSHLLGFSPYLILSSLGSAHLLGFIPLLFVAAAVAISHFNFDIKTLWPQFDYGTLIAQTAGMAFHAVLSTVLSASPPLAGIPVGIAITHRPDVSYIDRLTRRARQTMRVSHDPALVANFRHARRILQVSPAMGEWVNRYGEDRVYLYRESLWAYAYLIWLGEGMLDDFQKVYNRLVEDTLTHEWVERSLRAIQNQNQNLWNYIKQQRLFSKEVRANYQLSMNAAHHVVAQHFDDLGREGTLHQDLTDREHRLVSRLLRMMVLPEGWDQHARMSHGFQESLIIFVDNPNMKTIHDDDKSKKRKVADDPSGTTEEPDAYEAVSATAEEGRAAPDGEDEVVAPFLVDSDSSASLYAMLPWYARLFWDLITGDSIRNWWQFALADIFMVYFFVLRHLRTSMPDDPEMWFEDLEYLRLTLTSAPENIPLLPEALRLAALALDAPEEGLEARRFFMSCPLTSKIILWLNIGACSAQMTKRL